MPFPLLLILIETVLCWHSLPTSASLPTSLMPWLSRLDSLLKYYHKKAHLVEWSSTSLTLCDWSLSLSSACLSTVPPYLLHIPIILSHFFSRVLCWFILLAWNWPPLRWTLGILAGSALTSASPWHLSWSPKQHMITPYTTVFFTLLEF